MVVLLNQNTVSYNPGGVGWWHFFFKVHSGRINPFTFPHSLSPLICLYLPLVGWTQMPGRLERARLRRSAATASPEAHASVSLCYKSFRGHSEGAHTQYIFILLLSSLHPLFFFYYWMRFLWAPNLPLGSIKKRKDGGGGRGWRGETNKTRGLYEKRIKSERWRVEEEKKGAAAVWFHTGIKQLRAKVAGSFLLWIMNQPCFLIVDVVVNNSWFVNTDVRIVQGQVGHTGDATPPACQTETQSSSWWRSAVRTTCSDLLCVFVCMWVNCVCVCGRLKNIELLLVGVCVRTLVFVHDTVCVWRPWTCVWNREKEDVMSC